MFFFTENNLHQYRIILMFVSSEDFLNVLASEYNKYYYACRC